MLVDRGVDDASSVDCSVPFSPSSTAPTTTPNPVLVPSFSFSIPTSTFISLLISAWSSIFSSSFLSSFSCTFFSVPEVEVEVEEFSWETLKGCLTFCAVLFNSAFAPTVPSCTIPFTLS